MHSEKENQLDLEIIAYHGWGFDSTFWKDWVLSLNKNIQFKPADRGYFLEEKRPRFSEESKHRVLFLHSYGLHWCPHENIEQATCIVIFNGFIEFHPKKKQDRNRSVKVLQKMISEFNNNPEAVLNKFWKNSFFPAQDKETCIPKGKPDTELLLNDLKALNNSTFDLKQLKNGTPTMSLDGGSDRILTHNRGKKFTELTDGNAVYHFIKEAGHGLPVTHFRDCWSFINAMIPIFQHNGNYRRKKHQ